MRRCWPGVVPVLPPMGATGVGSLKPTPGASALTMVMVAAPWSARGRKREKAANRRLTRVPDIAGGLGFGFGFGWGGRGLDSDALSSGLAAGDAIQPDFVVGRDGGYGIGKGVLAEFDADGAA